MADSKVLINYINGESLARKFKFSWLMVGKVYKNSFKIVIVLIKREI